MAFGLIALFARLPHRLVRLAVAAHRGAAPLSGTPGPLATGRWPGVTDWPSVGLLAAVDRVFLASASSSFARRDIGVSNARAGSACHRCRPGSVGPFPGSCRTARRSPSAGGSGSGLYATLIVASADAFANGLGTLPQIVDLIKAIYPAIDITQPSGILQLTFFGFGSFILGLAGASFLAGWAGDEGRTGGSTWCSRPPCRGARAGRSRAGSGCWRRSRSRRSSWPSSWPRRSWSRR